MLEPGDTLNYVGYSVYSQPCILSLVLEPGDTLNCVGYTLSPVYSHQCWSMEILSTVLVILSALYTLTSAGAWRYSQLCWLYSQPCIHSHQCWSLEILSTMLVILSALYTLTSAGAWRYSQLCWLYSQPCILSPVLEPGDTLNCVGILSALNTLSIFLCKFKNG